MKKLEVRQLTKHFGDVVALNEVTLSLEEGQMLAVLGPSGCGKTTLLRSIAGFETPQFGSIYIDGKTMLDAHTNVKPELRKIGYVPQHGVLFPHLTVAKNIAFGLPSRMSKKAKQERVDEMLELVGMPGLSQRMPHELSGGQQQRIALARALAPSPTLVLLDEPFSALDAGLRQSLREEVKETLRQINATAIMVTHDQEEALSMADLVAVMREGECVQVADPTTIYQHPTDIKVAKFVGDATLLPAMVEQGVAQTPIGELSVSSLSPMQAGKGVVMIRPEQFRVCCGGVTGCSGQVLSNVYRGHSTLMHVKTDTPDGDHALQIRLNGVQQFDPGNTIDVMVDGEVMAYAD